jgi:hypothetical protein
MAGAYRSHDRRGRISFDWMLVAAALVAGALLAGTVIRTEAAGAAAQFGTHVGGLRTLGPTERLVLFEDMSSGSAAAWSGGRRDTAHVGLGAVWLADPADGALTREIALPEGTVRAVLSVDLIALDGWTGQGLDMAVNGTPVLRAGFGPGAVTEDLAAPQVELRSRRAAPADLGLGPAPEERLTVELAVTAPGPALILTIAPAQGQSPAWAVDNLIVVSERRP